MRRSPATILLAAVAMTALTARLGWWQLDRAAQKLERQSAIEERRSLSPLDGSALAQMPGLLDTQAYRRVLVRGRWDTPRTVYLDNRTMLSRAGLIVVTPLLLRDGTAVVVQRGWLPRDLADPGRIQPPATPDGDVEVLGLLAPPPARLYELGTVASGPIRQNLDIGAFSAETGLGLAPLSLLQIDDAMTGAAAQDGLLRHWQLPSADVHKHYGYAAQWFALSALTLGLYVWFQIIRPRRRGDAF